jgi:hypothetical protein
MGQVELINPPIQLLPQLHQIVHHKIFVLNFIGAKGSFHDPAQVECIQLEPP